MTAWSSPRWTGALRDLREAPVAALDIGLPLPSPRFVADKLLGLLFDGLTDREGDPALSAARLRFRPTAYPSATGDRRSGAILRPAVSPKRCSSATRGPMRLSSGKPSRAAREFAPDSRFSGNQSAGVRSANPVSPTTTVRCESVSACWVVAGRTGDCGAATQLCLAVGCPLSPFAENLVELTYGFASMSDQSVDKLPQRSGLQKVV